LGAGALTHMKGREDVASYNKVQLIGNVGKDAELKFLSTGTPIIEFSLAVSDGFGEKKTVSWWDVKQFGPRAESVAPYILKGGQVLVEGRLAKRSYEKDGTTIWRVDIIANDIVLLGSKQDGPSSAKAAAPARKARPVDDDDLPFE